MVLPHFDICPAGEKQGRRSGPRPANICRISTNVFTGRPAINRRAYFSGAATMIRNEQHE